MGTSLEDLKILQEAEAVADGIWRKVITWEPFAKEVVGGQLARAADSIGANIAKAFGRFHFGEKLQFLYYARGSLFDTKYWLNRAMERELITSDQGQGYATQLTGLARQLNAFANSLKAQRRTVPKNAKVARETTATYMIDVPQDVSKPLFNDEELMWLQTIATSS